MAQVSGFSNTCFLTLYSAYMMINFSAAIGSNCVTYQQVLNYFPDLSPVLLHKSNKINLTCSIRGTRNAASMLQVVSEVGSRWWTWSSLHFPPDEACFHLHGHVISQNSQYRSSVNPHLIHKVPLHQAKMGVWCAVNAKWIIGPIFFPETVQISMWS
jgi:hypothetical protein